MKLLCNQHIQISLERFIDKFKELSLIKEEYNEKAMVKELTEIYKIIIDYVDDLEQTRNELICDKCKKENTNGI